MDRHQEPSGRARRTATRVRGVIARRCGAGAVRRDGGRWRRGGGAVAAPPKKGQLKVRPAAGRRGRKSKVLIRGKQEKRVAPGLTARDCAF